MTGRGARRHIDHILLEIKALTTPRLRRHPNIASLLSWSYDLDSFQQPIALVMELASCDLDRLLSETGESIGWWRRFTLCSHIILRPEWLVLWLLAAGCPDSRDPG